MKKRIDEEKLLHVLEELRDKLIIVEGKKDKEALKNLGLKDIIVINGRPIYKVAEIASKTESEIVILTDFDEKGRKLNSKLRYLLLKYKKHVNSKIRGDVMSLGKNKIEDLINLKEGDVHVKVSSYFNKIRNKSSNNRKRGYRET